VKTESYTDVQALFYGFSYDIPFLGFFFILLALNPFRFIRGSIAALLTLLYFLDTSLLLNINTHLNISDIFKYREELKLVSLFLGLEEYLVFIVCLRAFFASKICLRKSSTLLVGALCTLTLFLQPLIPEYFSSNAFLLSDYQTFKPLRSYFPETQTLSEKSAMQPSEIKLRKFPKRVILIIVESLSSSISYRSGGVLNLLPKLDQFSEAGTLYPNVYASYLDSEGGLISLLTGKLPVPYTGVHFSLYRSFRFKNSLVNAYNEEGLSTAFITNGKLRFIDKDIFLKDTGFQRIYGPENVKELRFKVDDHHYPSDQKLFASVRNIFSHDISGENDFFLAIATGESHLPYTDERGNRVSREKVWNTVDTEITRFLEWLETTKFFENGVVAITSDHRRMQPVTSSEFHQYSESAPYRIPLILLGKNVKSGQIRRTVIAQHDILPELSSLVDYNYQEPDWLVIPDRFTVFEGFMIGKKDNYSAFFSVDRFKNRIPFNFRGRKFRWAEKPPALKPALEIEHKVTSLKSSYASFSQSGFLESRCEEEVPNNDFFRAQGLPSGSVYKGLHVSQLSQLQGLSDQTVLKKQIPLISGKETETLYTDSNGPLTILLHGSIVVSNGGDFEFRLYSAGEFCFYINQDLVYDRVSRSDFLPTRFEVSLESGNNSFNYVFTARRKGRWSSLKWRRKGERVWKDFESSPNGLIIQ
jgi:hypothetical protein